MNKNTAFFKRYLIFITIIVISGGSFFAYKKWKEERDNFEYFVNEFAFHYENIDADRDGFRYILNDMEKMQYSPVQIAKATSLGYKRSREKKWLNPLD